MTPEQAGAFAGENLAELFTPRTEAQQAQDEAEAIQLDAALSRIHAGGYAGATLKISRSGVRAFPTNEAGEIPYGYPGTDYHEKGTAAMDALADMVEAERIDGDNPSTCYVGDYDGVKDGTEEAV